MKKIITAAALILSMTLTLTLSGCFPTGEKDPNVSDTLSENGSFEYEKENLKVKFDRPKVPENIPSRVRVKQKYFDFDAAYKLFLDGKTLDPSRTGEIFYWTTDGTFMEYSEELNSLRYYEGSTCYNGLGTPENAPVNFCIYLDKSHEQYRNTYGIGRELEGFSSQDAIKQALELCSALGVNDLGEPEVFAFDSAVYEKLSEEQRSWINKDVPFTKDYEAYVLRFPQVICGTALADLNDVTISAPSEKYGEGAVYHTDVTVGVSKNGIFHFKVESAFEAEYEVIGTEPIKYGFDHALNEFQKYLERAYFKDHTDYNTAKIIYFPVTRDEKGYVEFTPAWLFRGNVKAKNSQFRVDNCDTVFLTDSGTRKDYITTS